jgi:opacity protein-like surface antigen
MRKYLLAAAAAAAIATPAAARDGSGYFGVEGGISWVKDADIDFSGTYSSEGFDYEFDGTLETDHKKGIDLDLIGGYDFGMVRLEGELGWKRAKHKDHSGSVTYTSSEGDTYTSSFDDIDADGKSTVLSAMVNVLLDFGNEDGLGFYAGGGAGWARTKVHFAPDTGDSDIDDVVTGTV